MAGDFSYLSTFGVAYLVKVNSTVHLIFAHRAKAYVLLTSNQP